MQRRRAARSLFGRACDAVCGTLAGNAAHRIGGCRIPELRVAAGREDEARDVLGRALRAAAHAHRCWDFFIAVARWGHADDIALARTMLAADSGPPPRCRGLFAALLGGRQPPEGCGALRALGPGGGAGFAAMGDGSSKASRCPIGGRISPPPHRRTQRPPERELTARQAEIAALVAQGETNKGIAGRLNISGHTVEHHLSGIFERLSIKSRSQLQTSWRAWVCRYSGNRDTAAAVPGLY